MTFSQKLGCALVAVVAVTGCTKKAAEDLASTIGSPTFTTPITFTNKTGASFTATWAATDDKTAAADISYKIVTSYGDNISTAADAEANGNVIVNWTPNLLTAPVVGLDLAHQTYVTVLAKDADANISVNTTSYCSGKAVFLATTTSGSLGGFSGADGICAAQKPTGFGSSTFKAMISTGTTMSDRKACHPGNCLTTNVGNSNWVLLPNTFLCKSDFSAGIGITNASATIAPTNSGILSTTTTQTFTGMNVNFASGDTTATCGGFNSTISASGNVGNASSSGQGFFVSGFHNCASAATIYCVEQ